MYGSVIYVTSLVESGVQCDILSYKWTMNSCAEAIWSARVKLLRTLLWTPSHCTISGQTFTHILTDDKVGRVLGKVVKNKIFLQHFKSARFVGTPKWVSVIYIIFLYSDAMLSCNFPSPAIRNMLQNSYKGNSEATAS